MPSGTASIVINASTQQVFDLLHDYSRRLEWDPFLRSASLLNAAAAADVGVQSRCVARWGAGGVAMETEYVSFSRPRIAAVRMTRGPAIFQSFGASLRQESIDENRTRVIYRYTFRARPSWLVGVIAPVVQCVFDRETVGRLAALKAFLEGEHNSRP